MSQILSKEQIRALYGFKANEEVVAFGARIKRTNPGRTNRRRKLEDMDFGSAEYNAEYDRLLKTPSKPAKLEVVVESDVQEIC